jgi:hypothetical protein
MTSPEWWHSFLKYAKAIKQSETAATPFTTLVDGAIRLFHILVDDPEKLTGSDRQELVAWLSKTEALLREVQQRELQTGHPAKRSFYGSFAKSISDGITVAKAQITPDSDPKPTQQTRSKSATEAIKIYKATRFGKSLNDLKRRYIEIMEAQHQARKNKGLKATDADEADRLHSFLKIAAFWLKRLQALEYATDVLKANLATENYPLEKVSLPLQFRLEQDSTLLTFRLVRANQRKPYPEDVSVLDVINDCYSIPVFLKEGRQLVEDPEVIRFLRLHSEKDNLTAFKQDDLSQLAQQMYHILLNTINDIKRLFDTVVNSINQTPLQDLEYAFSDINPEECRTLLRKKFQSLLPGINEKHYREETNKESTEQSVRTQETMEDYRKEFLKLKESVFGSLKTTMALVYWLRRMLMATLRSNILLEQKNKEPKPGEQPVQQKPLRIDFANHLMVGISITIGDEDIANFYINPDDIISSQLSIQRADKADKWIAVRKSDKTHRLLKKDFFGVIKNFIDKDLNPALQTYGFRGIDLNQQLLPEIQERLADEYRIGAIRSAILGTIITNLEEFRVSSEFHNTLRRYFKKPDYDNLHYPDGEKLSLVARGLTHSSTSIMQMKYRRVLKVKEEITERLKQLQQAMSSESLTPKQSGDLQDEYKNTKSLLSILNKVQQIMIFARPSLKEVKLEPEHDYVVVRLGEQS